MKGAGLMWGRENGCWRSRQARRPDNLEVVNSSNPAEQQLAGLVEEVEEEEVRARSEHAGPINPAQG